MPGIDDSEHDVLRWNAPPPDLGAHDYDDAFVARAPSHEASADERRRAFPGPSPVGVGPDWTGTATPASLKNGPMPYRGLVLLLALGLLVVLVDSLLPARQTGPELPNSLQLFVAVPGDAETNFGVVDAAEHEVGLAVDWLQATTGQQLRGDTDFGYVIELDATESDLRGLAEMAYLNILTEVSGQLRDERTFPVVMADVRTEVLDHGTQTCGLGGPAGIVVFLGNCRGFEPTTFSTWGSHASHTVAHELVHGMGAVWDCAPNTTGTGHVIDDPTDVLYEGPVQRSTSDPVVLDAGRNDYWGHGIPGCPDIMDSPLWDAG